MFTVCCISRRKSNISQIRTLLFVENTGSGKISQWKQQCSALKREENIKCIHLDTAHIYNVCVHLNINKVCCYIIKIIQILPFVWIWCTIRLERLYNIWSIPTSDSVWNTTHTFFGWETSGFDTSICFPGLKWAHVSYLFFYVASTCKSLYTEVYASLSGGAWKNGSSHPDQGLHFTASGIREHYSIYTEQRTCASH